MPTVAWLYSENCPLASGEVRQLALPATLLEGRDWTCRFEPANSAGSADVAVLSIEALHALGTIGGWPDAPVTIINLDDEAIERQGHHLDALLLAAGRIDMVVARGSASARWCAKNITDRTRCARIDDIADRPAELDAAAFRFGLRSYAKPTGQDEGGAYWFAEPGDLVDAKEVADLLDLLARTASDGATIDLIARRSLLAWLDQAGISGRARLIPWTPAAMARALASGRRVLLPDSPLARRRLAKLERLGLSSDRRIGREYEPWTVAGRWSELLGSVGRRPLTVPVSGGTLLIFLDLLQDVELALPVIDAALRRPGLRLRLACSTVVFEESQRLRDELAKRSITAEIYDRGVVNDGGISLAGVGALLTIVETTLPVHGRSHALTRQAQAVGIPTFTMQHGFENVGITYFDAVHDRSVEIYSDHIFVWFPADAIPAAVPERIRPRLVHVGRPRIFPVAERLPRPDRRTIAVFENLHWDRYSRKFRERFLADLFRLARVLDDVSFVVKPHPAGRWLSKNRESEEEWPSNVELADASHPLWANVTAAGLIAVADAVITTPSSVAVDATFNGRRVAVAGYDLDVEAYRPLPILRSFDDWLHFAISPGGQLDHARTRSAFIDRANIAGPSEERMIDMIETAIRRRTGRPSHQPGIGGSSAIRAA